METLGAILGEELQRRISGSIAVLSCSLVEEEFNSGYELLVGKRFRHIIGATAQEAVIFLYLTHFGCHSEYGGALGLGMLTNLAGDLEAIQIGQYNIQKNEIRLLSHCSIYSLLTFHHPYGLIRVTKQHLQDSQQILIIF